MKHQWDSPLTTLIYQVPRDWESDVEHARWYHDDLPALDELTLVVEVHAPEAALAVTLPTLIEGDPDEGKSTVAFDLAARVSTGTPMPFDPRHREPAGVVILFAEDALGDTIRPRLEAASAEAETWREVDAGLYAMKLAEAERLGRVLRILLPDDELRPGLRVLRNKPTRNPAEEEEP